jgi:hypothetical protein
MILGRAAAILRQRATRQSFWLDVICRVLTREAARISAASPEQRQGK